MFLCFFKQRVPNLLYKGTVKTVSNTIQQRLLSISCQVEQLNTRGLIRVSGDSVTDFLQGVVTNDMKHFQDGCKSLYAMFLNTKGRVLYDSIIYKTNNENTFYIECDREGLQDLVKHLRMYRVRRKIDVDSVDDEWKIWVLFNPKEVDVSNNNVKSINQEQIVPCTMPNLDDHKRGTFLTEIILGDNILVYADPRLSSLGTRVIASVSEDIKQCVQNSGVKVESSSLWSYRMFRYRLGVGEGTEELPQGKCFPLEANCDYLHGVSFHKGCYIGQEVTARTHHTGVVRKRLMPLILNAEVKSDEFPIDTPVEVVAGEKKSVIGKLRGSEKNCALGLMRIAEALEVNRFQIKNVEGETIKPFWWPQELPKERKESGSSNRS